MGKWQQQSKWLWTRQFTYDPNRFTATWYTTREVQHNLFRYPTQEEDPEWFKDWNLKDYKVDKEFYLLLDGNTVQAMMNTKGWATAMFVGEPTRERRKLVELCPRLTLWRTDRSARAQLYKMKNIVVLNEDQTVALYNYGQEIIKQVTK